MDDLAVLVEGDTPEKMLAKLSSALQTVKEVCQENAPTLNMSAGKTEAIVLVQGKQAKEVKRRMFAEGAAILETPAGPLRVVGSYRHLGCRVDCTRTQNAELAARRSSAQTAAVALGYSVLGDRAVPTKVRTCVARSTIHSRLLHQAGKWTCLSKTQLHLLHTRYSAPLGLILGQHKPPEPGTHRMRDDEILQTLKVPPLEAQLAVDKLRLAAQIATSQQALSMVVSSAGTEWREELVQALELVAVVMKDKLTSLPQPRVSPHIWEEFWNKWLGQWATLLRIFLARTAAGVAEFGKKAQGTVYATDGAERDQEWLCMQCGKWFPSRAACIGHQGVHGRDPTARNAQFVRLSSICGNDCGDTFGMAHAVACKQRVREWCRCSQWRMLSALTQPKRSRKKKACEGRDWQDVGSALSTCPTTYGSWKL